MVSPTVCHTTIPQFGKPTRGEHMELPGVLLQKQGTSFAKTSKNGVCKKVSDIAFFARVMQKIH